MIRNAVSHGIAALNLRSGRRGFGDPPFEAALRTGFGGCAIVVSCYSAAAALISIIRVLQCLNVASGVPEASMIVHSIVPIL